MTTLIELQTRLAAIEERLDSLERAWIKSDPVPTVRTAHEVVQEFQHS